MFTWFKKIVHGFKKIILEEIFLAQLKNYAQVHNVLRTKKMFRPFTIVVHKVRKIIFT